MSYELGAVSEVSQLSVMLAGATPFPRRRTKTSVNQADPGSKSWR